jgi:hypothetical protein
VTFSKTLPGFPTSLRSRTSRPQGDRALPSLWVGANCYASTVAFKGITSWADLRGAHESATFDAKKSYASGTGQPFEMAKDVAAFAAGVGGSIVVGAQEGDADTRGRIVAFESVGNPGTLIAAISSAVKAHCRPPPLFDALELRVGPAEATAILGREQPTAVTLVVVNVQPHLLGPIAVRVSDGSGRPIDGAYRFPNRVGEQGDYMQPERLAMLWGTHERRIAVELSEMYQTQKKLRPDLPCVLQVYDDASVPSNSYNSWRVDIDFERLFFDLAPNQPGHSGSARIPFTFVRAVWVVPNGYWMARVDGSLHANRNGEVFFVPGRT